MLHAVGHALQDGTTINLSGWDPSKAKNLFAGHTVHAMVLEVPDDVLLADAGSNRRIGVWAVSTLATDARGMALDQSRRPPYDPSAVHAI